MIIDLRTYTIAPGRTMQHLDLYEREGYEIQCKHLGKPIGYFIGEVGVPNQIVHIWGYESMADREKKRGALESDPAWNAYRAKSAAAGFLLHQENQILKSTSFSPL